MLIYVESKAFPYRTFTVRIQPTESIARIRAQILHILYEIGRDDHQFRLRYKGQYLRDAYTIEDYEIIDNSIVKMVPLSRRAESVVDLQSMGSDDLVSASETIGPGILPDIKEALIKEVGIFKNREELIFHFKGLLYVHFMAGFLCFLTTFWYSGFWSLALWLFAVIMCPTFTRIGGFIGKRSVYKATFCIVYGIVASAAVAVAFYFSIEEWTRIVNDGCRDWLFEGDCSHQVIFTAIFFALQALCFIISIGLVWKLLWNMKVEYGDYIERYLVQSRDIEEIMKAARGSSTKERRIAAFELATMAASGDDNKFRIVAEGGLEVLIRLALSRDEATQEHAVETIAELVTVPAIQDNFVEIGGVRTLTALLHTNSVRLVYQASTAISYITSDSEDNKLAIVSEHGLEDLAHAAHNTNLTNQRIIAGIFLEMAFNSDVRSQMASLNTPARALVKLCKSHDPETQRYAMQTLELLAIESPDMICAQAELLNLLLELPSRNYDTRVLTLAGKILLYYAENRETCESILDHTACKESLFQYARTLNSVLQKVVIKVIYYMIEVKELQYRARFLDLGEVLKYLRDHAADRETWDMADQALQALNSEDGLPNIPSLTTMEKLHSMNSQTKANSVKHRFGSQISIGSRASIRSNSSRKGI